RDARGHRLDHRPRRPTRRPPAVGLGHAAPPARTRPRRARALPRCPPDRTRPQGRARGAASPPPARALPDREPRARVGRRARRGGGARARPLRAARGADLGEARASDDRPARRPDPGPGPRDRRRRRPQPARPGAGRARPLRARLRLRPRDAPLPRRARHRPGRDVRARREAAVRRPALRPFRRRGARARRDARPRDARHRGGGGLTPRSREPVPAGATDRGTLPVPYAQESSALEGLLARGRVRATLAMLGPAFVAAIAYVDPGNFATNVQGGAKFGYLLLWVVLA